MTLERDHPQPWSRPATSAEGPHDAVTGEVIAFPRKKSLRTRFGRPASSPVPSMQRYEDGAEDDDYRHRMTVNAAAFVASVALIVVGLWLAIKIADYRRDQDCVLAGRKNCAQISVVKN